MDVVCDIQGCGPWTMDVVHVCHIDPHVHVVC